VNTVIDQRPKDDSVSKIHCGVHDKSVYKAGTFDRYAVLKFGLCMRRPLAMLDRKQKGA
jgi:hypothetical protein